LESRREEEEEPGPVRWRFEFEDEADDTNVSHLEDRRKIQSIDQETTVKPDTC
jgi:hypothetical protein